MVQITCSRCQREMKKYAKGLCVSCYIVLRDNPKAKQNSKAGRLNTGV
jgi:NMD protein affecting ribosome stability and mRNA decay